MKVYYASMVKVEHPDDFLCSIKNKANLYG